MESLNINYFKINIENQQISNIDININTKIFDERLYRKLKNHNTILPNSYLIKTEQIKYRKSIYLKLYPVFYINKSKESIRQWNTTEMIKLKEIIEAYYNKQIKEIYDDMEIEQGEDLSKTRLNQQEKEYIKQSIERLESKKANNLEQLKTKNYIKLGEIISVITTNTKTVKIDHFYSYYLPSGFGSIMMCIFFKYINEIYKENYKIELKPAYNSTSLFYIYKNLGFDTMRDGKPYEIITGIEKDIILNMNIAKSYCDKIIRKQQITSIDIYIDDHYKEYLNKVAPKPTSKPAPQIQSLYYKNLFNYKKLYKKIKEKFNKHDGRFNYFKYYGNNEEKLFQIELKSEGGIWNIEKKSFPIKKKLFEYHKKLSEELLDLINEINKQMKSIIRSTDKRGNQDLIILNEIIKELKTQQLDIDNILVDVALKNKYLKYKSKYIKLKKLIYHN